MKKAEVFLHMTEDAPYLTLETRKATGVTAFQNIAVDTFLQALAVKAQARPSGLLPPGCLQLVWAEQGWDVTLLSDLTRCDFTYHDTVFPALPLPRLLLACRVTPTGSLQAFRLGVLDDTDAPAPDTPLYHYPFSNVSGFALCTGANAFNGYDTLHKLRTLAHRIMRLPNNDDYFDARHNRLHLPLRALLQHLQGRDRAYYYTDVLIPSGKTLADFLQG